MNTKGDLPCMDPRDLCWGGDDYVPFEVADGSLPRAAVQRQYADEAGLPFEEVRCLRDFILIRTWAEAWEESSDREYQIEDLSSEAGFVERWFVDDFGDQYWTNIHEDYGYAMAQDELEDKFGQMPEDWDPAFIYGAYEFVDKYEPRAIPVWRCCTWS